MFSPSSAELLFLLGDMQCTLSSIPILHRSLISQRRIRTHTLFPKGSYDSITSIHTDRNLPTVAVSFIVVLPSLLRLYS